jgi:hypothetical protein
MYDPANYHPKTPQIVLHMLAAADDCAVDELWEDDICDILNVTGEFIEARKAEGEDPDVIQEMENALEGMSYCWNVEGDVDGYIAELERVYNIVQEA